MREKKCRKNEDTKEGVQKKIQKKGYIKRGAKEGVERAERGKSA